MTELGFTSPGETSALLNEASVVTKEEFYVFENGENEKLKTRVGWGQPSKYGDAF